MPSGYMAIRPYCESEKETRFLGSGEAIAQIGRGNPFFGKTGGARINFPPARTQNPYNTNIDMPEQLIGI